jgi:hypothetical protein
MNQGTSVRSDPKHALQLSAPPARFLRDTEARSSTELVLAIAREGERLTPFDVVGFELKFALLAPSIAMGDSSGDAKFWVRKCAALLQRPAVEPLLMAHWKRISNFEMTDEQMQSFCSLLCGSKKELRTRDSYGLWDASDVRFEPAEKARTWWSDIRAVATRPDMAPLLPCYAFARTIIAHPYPDGNGRLARALVHAALARDGGLSSPVVALAPAFYMNGARIAAALRDLSESGDWGPFESTFRQVLEHALALTRGLLSKKYHSFNDLWHLPS